MPKTRGIGSRATQPLSSTSAWLLALLTFTRELSRGRASMPNREHSQLVNWLVLGLVAWLILFPVLVVFLYAFATKWFPSHWWWPQEFGLRWFERILSSPNILNAMINSYVIAFIATLATLAITFATAYIFVSRTKATG